MWARAWSSDIKATIMMARRAVKTESFRAHTYTKLTGTGAIAATAFWRHGETGRAKESARNGKVDQRERQRGSVQERPRNPKARSVQKSKS